ncbi:ABC transporter ATP-binding protein [Chiayiivirga flava]|uniref:Iron complex transport system ATP-binding protein n=1 Tax=Chiayiivirga flava TaxID=659595 RepID=A0A7W8D6L6_9GAMM|nr:ATP-binding cassette domain-containing protein [Chiayiivirga flava]MBB5208879.1 iron complex transport system ATP-binding protein [Chiayiivirga flava]
MSDTFPAEDDAPLIELDRASVVRDGVTVLHDVSLRIPLGRHTAILGPNGCGKSSFVKLINRELYPLARGDGPPPARVFGHGRWNIAQLRTRLGLVSADLHGDLAQLRGLDVEDTVLSGLWGSFGVPDHLRVTDTDRARMHAALATMDALALLHRRLATLSAGEARRVLIARALMHRPQALLLDEPTTGLDVASRHRFLQLLRTIAQAGTTLVLVTHHLEEIVPEVRHVVLLRDGRVFAQGSAEAMLTSARMSALFGMALRVVRDGGFFGVVAAG